MDMYDASISIRRMDGLNQQALRERCAHACLTPEPGVANSQDAPSPATGGAESGSFQLHRGPAVSLCAGDPADYFRPINKPISTPIPKATPAVVHGLSCA